MLKLTRPEGSLPSDFHTTRRALGPMFFSGYALAAVSSNAQQQVHTDEQGLVCQAIRIPGPAGAQIPGYIARPNARGRFPAIIVIPEVFGIHEYIRDVCRRLAKLGYVAFAPDPFFRAGDPAVLTDTAQIQAIVATVSNEQLLADQNAVIEWLRRQPFAERRFGITGFCWGGAGVWMAMARFPDIRAGVAWYGRLRRPGPGEFLGAEDRPWPIDIVAQLRRPVLGLYAGSDQGIPVSDVNEMNALLAANRKRGSELIVYPNAQHGFHADYRATYNAEAAQDGWRRMLAHFDANGLAPRRF